MSSSLSSSDVAVSVRGLSKSYTIAHNAENHTTAAEALMHRLKNPLAKPQTETFWALKDVEFDIQKGDVVGIIGRNGAGKSTLLKVLSRITEPTTGQIDLYGRVGSLLEVGTGFHPELTGRENVYLNGAILGMKKSEISRQFDAIVDFSGTEQFLDTPVKRYSSGMYVRLAFAVAAHLNPEILIIDEVLAVGDAEFQKKCIGKMKDVANSGRTVIFVSHNINSVVALCNKGLLLQRGTLLTYGDVNTALDAYLTHGVPKNAVDLRDHPARKPTDKPHIEALQISDDSGRPTATFRPGAAVCLKIQMKTYTRLGSPRFGIGVNNVRGERVFAVGNFLSDSELRSMSGDETISARFLLPNLLPGTYSLDVSFSDGDHNFLDALSGAAFIEVEDVNLLNSTFPYFPEMGDVLVPSQWSLESHGSLVNQSEPALV